jgi:hypothetical protein
MFGDDPERIEAFRPRNAERIVGPEPAIGIMQAMIGVSCGIDQGGRNLRWNVDVPVQGGCRIHALPRQESFAPALAARAIRPKPMISDN